MKLRVVREPSVAGATHGALYINSHFHCWVLEDEIRERPGLPVEHWKIYGQTAIPSGEYEVKLTPSQRFRRVLPEVLNVPGFVGIRMHAGNTVEDTEGCLLVGSGRTSKTVTGSRVALERLLGVLTATTEPILIRVENP